METKEPYFLKNKDWYYYDNKNYCYRLTKKATKEAKASYDKYYKNLVK